MAHGLLEIAKEIVIALGVDIAFKKVTENAAVKAGEYVSDKVFKDKRAELLKSFMDLPASQTDNLWRRHREAMREFRENRFVTLLCKIPPGDRPEMLTAMNRMNDADFQQHLAMLENDVVVQTFHRTGHQLRLFRDEVVIPSITSATAAIDAFNRELEALVPRVRDWARR